MIPRLIQPREGRTPLAGQVIATIRKGSQSFPSTTAQGKPYNAMGLDLGQYMRVDDTRPQDGITPLNPIASAMLRQVFPTLEFAGTPGKIAVPVSGVPPAQYSRRFKAMVATAIHGFLASPYITEALRVEYTEGASIVKDNGRREFSTRVRCDGENCTIVDPKTGRPGAPRRCRAYDEPDKLGDDGLPVSACEKCKLSCVLYLRTQAGVVAVSTHSTYDARHFAEFLVRGPGAQYGANIHRVPLILSRRLTPTKELRDGKLVPTEKWQYALSVAPAFSEREFALLEQVAAERITGVTLSLPSPVAPTLTPVQPPTQHVAQPLPNQPSDQSPGDQAAKTWSRQEAVGYLKEVGTAKITKAEAQAVAKAMSDICAAFSITVPDDERKTIKDAAAYIMRTIEAMPAAPEDKGEPEELAQDQVITP